MGFLGGGKSAASAYTLIETAKLSGIDPQSLAHQRSWPHRRLRVVSCTISGAGQRPGCWGLMSTNEYVLVRGATAQVIQHAEAPLLFFGKSFRAQLSVEGRGSGKPIVSEAVGCPALITSSICGNSPGVSWSEAEGIPTQFTSSMYGNSPCSCSCYGFSSVTPKLR
jgi:hypothetical protein